MALNKKTQGVEKDPNCFEKRMVRPCRFFFARLGGGTAVPPDSGNLIHTMKHNASVVSRRFYVRPLYHSGRVSPFLQKQGSLIVAFHF
ncbi:hypothetical protein SFRURICE_015974 [Spodoptera frugiperda]|nr:hypothetical protein SFRURICE_015974 [Spodoptera frugiperda]